MSFTNKTSRCTTSMKAKNKRFLFLWSPTLSKHSRLKNWRLRQGSNMPKSGRQIYFHSNVKHEYLSNFLLIFNCQHLAVLLLNFQRVLSKISFAIWPLQQNYSQENYKELPLGVINRDNQPKFFLNILAQLNYFHLAKWFLLYEFLLCNFSNKNQWGQF